MTSTIRLALTRSPYVAVFCLIVVGGLLGVSINIAKMAIGADMSPVTLLFWASLGSGLLLQIVAISRRQAPKINRRTLEYGVVSGLLFAVPNIVALLTIPHIGAGLVSLTLAFPILFTYALALTIGLEVFARGRFLGVLFGLGGAVLLALPKVSSADPLVFWFIAAMTAPVIIAVGNIYRTARWPKGETALSLAPMMLIGGALATILIMTVVGDAGSLIDVPSQTALFLVFAQTAVFTVMYGLYFVLQWLAGPVYLSQIGSIAAVVGVLMAVGLLEEELPLNLPVAAVLIGAGVVLVSWTARRKLPAIRRRVVLAPSADGTSARL